MDQEFEKHIQEIGEKMKTILDLATGKNWVIDPIIDKWDVNFEGRIAESPISDFVWQSRFIEFGRHIDFVKRFGWDQYAIDFANEARMYFQNTCFKNAKEQLGFVDKR